MKPWSIVALSLCVAGIASGATAAGSEQVRVSIEFRQSGTTDENALQGSVVIRERGGIRSNGRLDAASQTTRVTRSSGIFTLVQDGGDSLLRVATRVPYEDVQFYRDYALGSGYLSRTIAFQDVGTSLRVHADVLGDRRIRLRLVPTVSYLSPEGSGSIDFTDAATELVVEDGKPVDIGGGTTRSQEITRRILGYGSKSAESETSIVLRAVLQ